MAGAFLYLLALVALTTALYFPFSANPPFFDDLQLFSQPQTQQDQVFQFVPRWVPYWTIELTRGIWGDLPTPYRLTSLALHLCTVITLFFLLQRLLSIANPEIEVKPAAFAGTLLFALHPIAVFATGYLIQRTGMMATLFTLLMWWAFLRGSQTRRPLWLYASAILFLFAAYSKEHAVTAAAIPVILYIWLARSGRLSATIRFGISKHHMIVMMLYGITASTVIAGKIGLVAAPYEPMISYLLVDLPFDKEHAYPFSLLTQSGLFFKYLYLWIIPNTTQMSIDMREPIAISYTGLPYSIAPLAFTAYIIGSALLLWRGGRAGLLGIALLVPAIMFATELSTVRIQEPFVLYRSYLWAPLSFALATGIAFSMLTRRIAWMMLALVSIAFALFSANQLYTFTRPVFVWDQAATLVEGRQALLGTDRIYHNRGDAYYSLGIANKAISDYDRAIEIAPMLPFSYNNRGALLLDMGRHEEALRDFNRAISISQSSNPLMGRGLTYLALGNIDAARQDFYASCKRGFNKACDKLVELEQYKKTLER